MTEQKHLVLPITGMTCANCVASVERNLKKEKGVESAVVNLSSERATIVFDPQLTQLPALVQRIQRAGYGIAEGEADLAIKRMSDDNDARRLEKLLSAIEGVSDVRVNFINERAHLRYVPTLVSQMDLRRAVSAAGFEVLETGGESEDAEGLARQKEIDQQKRLLIIGLIFTIPLFILAMSSDLGLLPMNIAHSAWIKWVMLFLAIPVQFYVGWQYYVGAYKSLRNGSANMDVLVALGTSAAFLYSLPVTFGLLSGHVYFETAAVIIVLIKLGKLLEVRSDFGGTRFTGENGSIFVDRGRLEASNPELLRNVPADFDTKPPNHWQNFIECVRSRKLPASNAEGAHRAASFGQLGIVAMDTKQLLKWDPQAEKVLDNTAQAGHPRLGARVQA